MERIKSTPEKYIDLTGKIHNPFGNQPVYYIETTTSTMDDARELIKYGALPGTVIFAGTQTKGRGRFETRRWQGSGNESLLFTLILSEKYFHGFTLKMGLGTAKAFRRIIKDPEIKIEIKWPNDIMINGKKVAGMVCEKTGDFLIAGIGCNLGQKEFAPELRTKATSLFQVLKEKVPEPDGFLPLVLEEIKSVLESHDWQEKINDILYRKNTPVRFYRGFSATDSIQNEKNLLKGILKGIGPDGELLIQTEKEVVPCFSGELEVYKDQQ